jgi:hypothetical protein
MATRFTILLLGCAVTAMAGCASQSGGDRVSQSHGSGHPRPRPRSRASTGTWTGWPEWGRAATRRVSDGT